MTSGHVEPPTADRSGISAASQQPAGSALEAICRLQSQFADTARQARAWGPELRRLLDDLERFLPPRAERESLFESGGELPYALDLFAQAECLLGDGLSRFVAEAESVVRQLPGDERQAPADAAAVWREIDPGAPAVGESQG